MRRARVLRQGGRCRRNRLSGRSRRASPGPRRMRIAPRVPVPEKCNMAMVASNMSGHIQKQLTRSLERILEEAHLSGELKLSGRKLKDFPKVGKAGAAKYNLQDTVIAGELSSSRAFPESLFFLFFFSPRRGRSKRENQGSLIELCYVSQNFVCRACCDVAARLMSPRARVYQRAIDASYCTRIVAPISSTSA